MSTEVFSANQPRELISQAVQWLEHGHQLALLTLINIEGNAPYPVGTQMLVNEQGQFCGQITGGCAELALADQAVTHIKYGKNTAERYGLNSKYFDIQLPCGSGIDIYFDVQKSAEQYQLLERSLLKRESISEVIEFGDLETHKRYLPNERILLFGQGPIKSKLIDLATEAGFEVCCFDHTKRMDFEEYCDPYTSLVSLFHEHDLETDILAKALEFDLFYFGALGSHRTHSARLDQLRDKGLEQNSLDRIYGPIGSNIGAVSPAQIAISILSELISVMNQGGRFAN